MIDAWWRCIWKRKNPWYDAWRNLQVDADNHVLNIVHFCFTNCPIRDRHDPNRLLYQEKVEDRDVSLPPSLCEASPNVSSVSVAPTSVVRRLICQCHQAWIRSVSLLKPSIGLMYTFLHLAACTTKYLIPPYVSHNKLSISVHMPNEQFGSFPNPHFFVHTAFKRFENLKLDFQNQPSVTYTASASEVEEALHDNETTSTSSSLSYLTESDDNDLSPQISTGSPALISIPPLPPVSNNNTNLPFMQTFITNISIF